MRVKEFKSIEPLSGERWVGIDQSYSGFAITAIDVRGSFYTQVGKSELLGVSRLLEINNFLSDFLYTIVAPLVLDVAMEGYAYGSQMSHMLGELGGLVKVNLRSQFGPCDPGHPLIIPPTTLKKYIAGKGTGVQKSQILLYTFKNWGVEFTDDNAADSYGLARLASGHAKYAYQKDIINNVRDPKYRER